MINRRSSNNIVKMDMSGNDAVWKLGGSSGDFDIVDEQGKTWPKGTTYWAGAHNAEYFGNNEFFMFDNNFNVSSADFLQIQSRLLGLGAKLEDAGSTRRGRA